MAPPWDTPKVLPELPILKIYLLKENIKRKLWSVGWLIRQGADDYYLIDSINAGENINIELNFIINDDSPYGHSFVLNLNINSDENTYNSELALNVENLIESFESGNLSNLPWDITSGDSEWTLATLGSYEGLYSSQSGAIDHNMSSELSITIDGTGGIFAGEAFSSSYIPKRYREACVFQIMDVAHELDSSGWKTTLRGLMRIDYGFGAKKPIVDMLKELLLEQTQMASASPDDPPYLNFSEYLTKTNGRKSPFKTQPPKAFEKPLSQEEKRVAKVKELEADQKRGNN